MPLSEHEQRLLEQIEQGLYAEDPKFASTVRRVRRRTGYRRRIILSIVGIVLGLGLVLLGLVSKLIFISVIGFVLIVAACVYAFGPTIGRNKAPTGPLGLVDPSTGGTKARRQSGMKEKMEDRLRRRFDEQ
jgi:hypothetical protein